MTKTTKEFDVAYKKLNAEQRLAVDTIEGPVMLVAGPGTGKTQTLALRIANIIRKTDTPRQLDSGFDLHRVRRTSNEVAAYSDDRLRGLLCQYLHIPRFLSGCDQRQSRHLYAQPSQ